MQGIVEVLLEFLDHVFEGQLGYAQLGGRDLLLLLEHELLSTVLESELSFLAVLVEFLNGLRRKSVLSGGILLVGRLDELDRGLALVEGGGCLHGAQHQVLIACCRT